MKTGITYDYDPGTGIFRKIHFGDIVFEDVINSWNEIIGKQEKIRYNKEPITTNNVQREPFSYS